MLKGIDVSHWNGNIDWNLVKNSGNSFAFCKATQGVGMIDPTFQRNIQAASDSGLIVGAYHFLNPTVSGRYQADFFAEYAKPNMLLALDIEGDGWYKETPQECADEVSVFMTYVKIALGKYPLLYFSPSFAKDRLRLFPIKQYDWWIASYTPNVPEEFSKSKFWQFTESGNCPGINGNCDLDFFFGEEKDLIG
jgi:lysozyme